MKRIISLIMALALVFTMSIPVFATEPSNGKITITNATIDEVYNLYKVFDATLAVDEEGKTVYDGGKPVISYTMDTKVEDSNGDLVPNPLFVAMFGSEANPENDYFTFTPAVNENKGNIGRKDGATTEDIQKYLKDLYDEAAEAGKPYPLTDSKTAVSQTVIFENLEYGYYMLDKANGTMVSLTSTTPDVTVIDKNQIPGTEFNKKVWNETENDWEDSTSANVGDILNFKIDFEATNYHGDTPVKYYQVKDTKGSSLWVEFNKITVRLEGLKDDPETTDVDESVRELNKGYYHYAADPSVTDKTNEWEFFGTWTDAEKAAENKEDLADWYLIHRGYDSFDIVIPWMENHDFTGTDRDFTLTYGENPTSKYPSPATVVVEYTASVEPSATIGKQEQNTLWNQANLIWNTGSNKDPETTNVTVFALGLTKTNDTKEEHLAGAVFELYKLDTVKDADGEPVIGETGKEVIGADGKTVMGVDGKPVIGEDGQQVIGLVPVYVIPTGVDGIYIVDDLNTKVSGNKRESARELYKAYLEAYLGANYATTQKNVLTTEVNGKFLVKGLAAGDYYIKETKAPDGYNLLPTIKKVTVGETNDTFTIIADANGRVLDKETAGNGEINITYTATSVVVPNSRGVELPSTGGEGAMRLITFGTIIAIAFAALLITHKKMTVYED